MGIHYWSKPAVLTLLVVLSIGHAHAATRKYVSMPSDGQVIGSGKGSSVSGDLLTVPGNPIEGEYIPSSYGGGSKGTKLPIQPKYQYVKSRTIKGMVGTLKGGNVGAIGLTIGLQYMLDAVGGFIEDNQVMVPSAQDAPLNTSYIHWGDPSGNSSTRATTPIASCQKIYDGMSNGQQGMYKPIVAQPVNWITTGVQAYCVAQYCDTSSCTNKVTKQTLQQTMKFGTACAPGDTYDQATHSCKTSAGSRPATDADFDLMEAAASAKDSEWLKDRLREHCEGSLNPQGCYDELRDNTWLEGPASVTEPGPTVSTTGPSGTTTSTTNTKIDITYGDNYYDYRTTKTTIVTKPDGSTETTTETEPETEQPREEEEQDINFTDSEFPPVEPFYQQKYPDGLEGVWQDAQAKFDNSQFMSFLQSFIPQFSGSCPSWSMSFNIATWASYGNVPFVNLCYVFDFIKVIMLVTALFTARAITFGG